jgi:hypothetical protein
MRHAGQTIIVMELRPRFVAKKNSFQQYICRPYCMFFKDGQKEEMSCRGAEAVERLVQQGSVDPANMPALRKEPAVWERQKDALGARVCRTCAFFPEDCDYQGGEAVEGAEPCGGFILLSLLYQRGLIRMTDLE